jgi:hypothetical protein
MQSELDSSVQWEGSLSSGLWPRWTILWKRGKIYERGLRQKGGRLLEEISARMAG